MNRPKEEIVAEFKEIINHAKDNNMEVILDVAPAVFDQLGISYSDLSFFAELGADGIRLDVGFDGLTEAKMTNNPYGLKIELNVSNDIAYLENILSHQANKSALIGCHNFYPQNSLVFRTIISFAVVNALKAWYSQCGFYYITCRKHRSMGY